MPQMPPEQADRMKDTRWKPGVSANPAGRPKGSGLSLVDSLRRYLKAHPGEGDAIIHGLVQQAKEGNIKAVTEIFDRIDGPVERHTQLDVLPIRLVFTPAAELLPQKTYSIDTPSAIELPQESIVNREDNR